MPSLYTSLTM